MGSRSAPASIAWSIAQECGSVPAHVCVWVGGGEGGWLVKVLKKSLGQTLFSDSRVMLPNLHVSQQVVRSIKVCQFLERKEAR